MVSERLTEPLPSKLLSDVALTAGFALPMAPIPKTLVMVAVSEVLLRAR